MKMTIYLSSENTLPPPFPGSRQYRASTEPSSSLSLFPLVSDGGGTIALKVGMATRLLWALFCLPDLVMVFIKT